MAPPSEGADATKVWYSCCLKRINPPVAAEGAYVSAGKLSESRRGAAPNGTRPQVQRAAAFGSAKVNQAAVGRECDRTVGFLIAEDAGPAARKAQGLFAVGRCKTRDAPVRGPSGKLSTAPLLTDFEGVPSAFKICSSLPRSATRSIPATDFPSADHASCSSDSTLPFHSGLRGDFGCRTATSAFPARGCQQRWSGYPAARQCANDSSARRSPSLARPRCAPNTGAARGSRRAIHQKERWLPNGSR